MSRRTVSTIEANRLGQIEKIDPIQFFREVHRFDAIQTYFEGPHRLHYAFGSDQENHALSFIGNSSDPKFFGTLPMRPIQFFGWPTD